MKSIRSFITSGLVALAAAAPALASSPAPLRVVHPTGLTSLYRGAEVTLKVTLDRDGNVRRVAGTGELPQNLKLHLLPAIAQWRFTPARDAQGRAVASEVILPLKLVDGGV